MSRWTDFFIKIAQYNIPHCSFRTWSSHQFICEKCFWKVARRYDE